LGVKVSEVKSSKSRNLDAGLEITVIRIDDLWLFSKLVEKRISRVNLKEQTKRICMQVR
jgi:hypothetical protein